MEIFIIIFYGAIIISLVLLPYFLFLAIKALRIYLAKNTMDEPKPDYTRFENHPSKTDDKP